MGEALAQQLQLPCGLAFGGIAVLPGSSLGTWLPQVDVLPLSSLKLLPLAAPFLLYLDCLLGDRPPGCLPAQVAEPPWDVPWAPEHTQDVVPP